MGGNNPRTLLLISQATRRIMHTIGCEIDIITAPILFALFGGGARHSIAPTTVLLYLISSAHVTGVQ